MNDGAQITCGLAEQVSRSISGCPTSDSHAEKETLLKVSLPSHQPRDLHPNQSWICIHIKELCVIYGCTQLHVNCFNYIGVSCCSFVEAKILSTVIQTAVQYLIIIIFLNHRYTRYHGVLAIQSRTLLITAMARSKCCAQDWRRPKCFGFSGQQSLGNTWWTPMCIKK